MKKRFVILLVALAFILGTMVSGMAAAGENFKVLINGRELVSNPSPVIIDGRIFVPLRAVSDYMGASVGWDEANKIAYIASQRDALRDIEITGPAEFQELMRKSLSLLRDRAPEEYLYVGKYIRKIGMDENLNRGLIVASKMEVTFEKPIANEYWWAAGLVHEATHAEQRYSVRLYSVEQAEMEAEQKEIEVLKKIGAPKDYIQFAEQQSEWWKEPLYKN